MPTSNAVPDALPLESPSPQAVLRDTGASGHERGVAGAIARNIGFIVAALVLVYCVVHAFDPPRLNWGDSMSDYNVMNSGRNFWRYGFIALRFTPFLLDPHFIAPLNGMFVYTHYPQLPDLLNGVERDLGLSTLTQFRFVALAFSFGSLVWIYRLLAMYWSRSVAQIALALWVLNPLWIQHADYLHHAPLGAFFGFGSVYFLARHLRDGGRRRFFVASGVFLFFTMLASYDYWFFTPLLLTFVTIAHDHRRFLANIWRILTPLGLCGAAALAFKFGTNAWVLGGVGRMLHDFRFQYTERATDLITKSTFERGLWIVLEGRVERFFTLLLFPVALLWLVLPFVAARVPRWSARINALGPNPWLLFAAAFPFLWIFKEIWMGQYYPGLLVLPFYAVAFAVPIVVLWKAERPSLRLLAPVLFVALAANSAFEVLTFPKAFLRPETIASMSAQLDSVARPGQEILVDHVFDAAFRYYFGRNSNAAILIRPGTVVPILARFADPLRSPRSGTPTGAIFVHDKHLVDDMYDKSYYYLLGRYGFWNLWANPEAHRATIDTIVAFRDSVLMAAVAQEGERLYDTKDYSIWRINRQPEPDEIPLPSRRN